MKRLGQKIFVLVMLAGLIVLPLSVDARVNLSQATSHCSMAMSPQAAAMNKHCHTAECKHCSSCHVCMHGVGSVAVGQGMSGLSARVGGYFDHYTSSFYSIYPPVDSPPPRHS